MVTVTDIKIHGNILTAKYYPEGQNKDLGFIKYDLDKKQAVEIHYCEADRDSFLKAYAYKAVRALKKHPENESWPDHLYSFWY